MNNTANRIRPASRALSRPKHLWRILQTESGQPVAPYSPCRMGRDPLCQVCFALWKLKLLGSQKATIQTNNPQKKPKPTTL